MTLMNKTLFFPLIKICSLGFLFLFPTLLLSQVNSFHFIQSDPISILDSIENQYGIDFNYDHSILEIDQTYSFGVSGTSEEVLQVLSSMLKVKAIQLDDQVFVLQRLEEGTVVQMEPPIISGRVVDEFQKGMVAARISIPMLGLYEETDLNGNFAFRCFLAGDEEIQFSYLGYETFSLRSNQCIASAKVISLKPKNHLLGEIIIQQKRPVSETELLNQQSNINTKDVLAAGTVENDGLALSQQIVGVYNATESMNDIQIRGGSPGQNQLSVNGIRLFQTSLYYGKVASVNPLMTDLISVNKNGAASNRAGGASSIELNTSLEQDSTITGTWHTNLLFTNAGLKVPLFKGKLQAKIAYRRSINDFIKSRYAQNFFDNSFQFGSFPNTFFYKELYNLDWLSVETNFGFQDLSCSFLFKPNDRWQIQLNTLQVKNGFSFLEIGEFLDAPRAEVLNISNGGVNLAADYFWNPCWKTSASFSRSSYAYNGARITNYLVPSRNRVRLRTNEVNHLSFRLDQVYKKGPMQTSFGLALDFWKVGLEDFSVEQGVRELFDVEGGEGVEQGIYIDQVYTLDRWKFQAGLRYSTFNLTLPGVNFLEPRVHVSFVPTEKITLHGHYGQYHQVISRFNEFTELQAENSFWYLVDESAETEDWRPVITTEQASLGFVWKDQAIETSVDFYQKNTGLLWTSAFDYNYEENPYFFVESRVKGMELSLGYQKNNWSFLNTYNWMQDRLVDQLGQSFNSPYFQPLRIGMQVSFQKENLHASLSWNFASGRYYSEPEDFEIITNPDGTVSSYSTLFSELNNVQGPNYKRMDLSLKYNLPVKSKTKFALSGSIINLMNRANITRLMYFTDFTKEPVATSLFQRKGLPFTPNIALDISF